MRLILVAVGSCVLTVTACDVPAGEPSVQTPKSQVASVADEYADAYFAAFPIDATLSGKSSAAHDQLGDISLDARRRWEAKEDSIIARLDAMDESSIEAGSADAVTRGFLRELAGNSKAVRVCHMELWNVSPTWTGWQQVMAGLAEVQPVGTAEQREAAYRRFAELPRYLDQEAANLREGLKQGYSAPKGNVQGVIDQLNAYLATEAPGSPFVQMAPDSGGDEFKTRLLGLEGESLRPAITKFRDFLIGEYKSAARAGIAVSENPNGADCYRAAIRYHSTVDITPEEVHRIGLEQMAKIRGEMQEIARRSFGTNDVANALTQLKTDARYLMTTREATQRFAEAAVERARVALPKAFGILPKSQVRVEPFPAFSEANAPGGQYSPAADDGSRPGIYYINLRNADKLSRAGIESTAFHEAYPGHHLQNAIAQEREGLHQVQRYFYMSGFGEGWGLYSERLADEMGLFGDDVDRIGLLSNEALRAARLVVDPGMHALGWSRERAIQYMLDNTAESRESVTAEVDRYIAVPGQATAYMLGNLEIRRLREEAKQALGDKFDLRAFHDRVLEDGAVPLVMLRAKIERWLASMTSGS